MDIYIYIYVRECFWTYNTPTTDTRNDEDELVVILHCGKDDIAGEIKSCARYFTIKVPKKADATGIITCLGTALKHLGVDDVLSKHSVLGAEGKPVLIGGGTGGASVNIIGQHNGMKAIMQRELPWLFGHGAMSITQNSHARMPFQAHFSNAQQRCYFSYTTFTQNLPKSLEIWLTMSLISKRFLN